MTLEMIRNLASLVYTAGTSANSIDATVLPTPESENVIVITGKHEKLDIYMHGPLGTKGGDA
jgi:hypothetical protein